MLATDPIRHARSEEKVITQTIYINLYRFPNFFLLCERSNPPLGAATDRTRLVEQAGYLAPFREDEMLERRQLLLHRRAPIFDHCNLLRRKP
jgi:hypothetical protein